MLVAYLNAIAGQMGAYPNTVYYGLVALGVVLLAVALAGYWKIFEKMGEPGWKALIPFYNNWVIFRRCAEYWQLFVVYLVAGVVELACNFGVFGIFSASVEEWARIVCSGAEFYMLFELARCFGKGWVTGVGLWLAEFAFAPLLGFGSARYLGCHSGSVLRFGTKATGPDDAAGAGPEEPTPEDDADSAPAETPEGSAPAETSEGSAPAEGPAADEEDKVPESDKEDKVPEANQANQVDQADQASQANQADQADQANQANQGVPAPERQ